jgi:hypothetical protein
MAHTESRLALVLLRLVVVQAGLCILNSLGIVGRNRKFSEAGESAQ